VITLAVPKGRVLGPLAKLFARAGIDASALERDDRALVREAGELRFLLLKPDDVPTYVEHGAADAGVCGRDVLEERGTDVLKPLDLGIGRCRLVVAGKMGADGLAAPPRVATKYPRTAEMHFARKGVQAEIVFVQSSVELAPIVGLSDLIVDLVETGETLQKNGLEIREEIAKISSLFVANRASYKLQRSTMTALVDKLRACVSA
jgi:ATP phosphoribosyltransferase